MQAPARIRELREEAARGVISELDRLGRRILNSGEFTGDHGERGALASRRNDTGRVAACVPLDGGGVRVRIGHGR